MKKIFSTHKTIIITLLAIYNSGSLKAENKLGMIEAPDQTVIVRAKACDTSEQLLTLNDGDFFYYEPAMDGLWTKIYLFPAEGVAEGYIPKTNVRLVEALTETQKKKIITDVLTMQQSLAKDFRMAVHETPEKNKVAREKSELHDKKKYIYALEMIPPYLKSTSDSAILQLLLTTMYADRGSANELPATILAQCLVVKPELTINLIKEITDEAEQTRILKEIEFGLDNYYHQLKDDLDIQKKHLLENLETNIPR